MTADKRWVGAVEHVENTGRVLKDIIKASAASESQHTPSLKNALAHARSAFIESQEWERKVHDAVREEEEKARAGLPQGELSLGEVVQWRNEQSFPVLARVGVADWQTVGAGECIEVPNGATVEWVAQDQSANASNYPVAVAEPV